MTYDYKLKYVEKCDTVELNHNIDKTDACDFTICKAAATLNH